MAVLNISAVSITFSNARTLNLQPQDLAQDMMSIEYDEPSVGYARGAVAPVRSLNFYQIITINANILKTSTRFRDYQSVIHSSASLDGTATITLENGASFVISNLSVDRGGNNIGGTDAISAPFVIKGSTEINVSAMA